MPPFRDENPDLPTLEPLETHSGLVLGWRRTPLPPEDGISNGEASIRQSLEEILTQALARPPCLVAFSGGRDSSALLALATHVARNQGLDDPVPITFRFDDYPRTKETEWQEQIIRHLNIKEWEIVPGAEHFDALGPNVRDTLRRYGPYWAPSMHALIPLLRAARGGTLITGNGGDEVFTRAKVKRIPSPWRVLRAGSVRRALFYGAVSVLPYPWKQRLSYQGTLRLSWLTPSARREVRRRFLARFAKNYYDGRHPLFHFHESRYLEVSRAIGAAFARDAGAMLLHPFHDPRFLGAWIRWAPPGGYASRSVAMETHFGDLLPAAATRRQTKAMFTEAAWGPSSREFSANWNGTGLDTDLVDPVQLQRIWSSPRPDFRTLSPLHVAWLASDSTETHTRNRGVGD